MNEEQQQAELRSVSAGSSLLRVCLAKTERGYYITRFATAVQARNIFAHLWNQREALPIGQRLSILIDSELPDAIKKAFMAMVDLGDPTSVIECNFGEEKSQLGLDPNGEMAIVTGLSRFPSPTHRDTWLYSSAEGNLIGTQFMSQALANILDQQIMSVPASSSRSSLQSNGEEKRSADSLQLNAIRNLRIDIGSSSSQHTATHATSSRQLPADSKEVASDSSEQPRFIRAKRRNPRVSAEFPVSDDIFSSQPALEGINYNFAYLASLLQTHSASSSTSSLPSQRNSAETKEAERSDNFQLPVPRASRRNNQAVVNNILIRPDSPPQPSSTSSVLARANETKAGAQRPRRNFRALAAEVIVSSSSSSQSSSSQPATTSVPRNLTSSMQVGSNEAKTAALSTPPRRARRDLKGMFAQVFAGDSTPALRLSESSVRTSNPPVVSHPSMSQASSNQSSSSSTASILGGTRTAKRRATPLDLITQSIASAESNSRAYPLPPLPTSFPALFGASSSVVSSQSSSSLQRESVGRERTTRSPSMWNLPVNLPADPPQVVSPEEQDAAAQLLRLFGGLSTEKTS